MKINEINIYSFHVRGESEWIFLEAISTNGVSGLSELTMSNKHFLQMDLVKLIKTQINKLLTEDLNSDLQIKNILEEGESEINNSLVLATVISGIRSACSDIFAQNKSLSLRDYLVKFYNLPKATLDAVPLYANINRSLLPNNNGPVDRSANSFKLKAKKAIKDGFKFIKCAPFDQYPESFYKDKKFISEGFKKISSVVPVQQNNDFHPLRAKKFQNNKLKPYLNNSKNVSTNRQDLENNYFLCHNFWTIRTKEILRLKI